MPLFATRMVNRVLHTSYRVDEVMEFDAGVIEVIGAVGAVGE